MSKIFINGLSCVDLAYADSNTDFIPMGYSFCPSFELEGPVEQTEQVIIDFGTAKKLIKKGLDEIVDHKLWVFPSGFNLASHDGRVTGRSGGLEFELPKDALYLVPEDIDEFSLSSAQTIMESEVNNYLQRTYPDIKVTCLNDEEFSFPEEDLIFEEFNYTHGLKSSTSWGCQNMLHGHLSYLAVKCGPQYSSEVEDYLEEIARELTGSMFVFSENIVKRNGNSITLSYTTPARGKFKVTVPTGDCKVVVIDKETTIENLSSWLADREKTILQELNVQRLYISEGLTKGAVSDIE
jgi:hypothetical protein